MARGNRRGRPRPWSTTRTRTAPKATTRIRTTRTRWRRSPPRSHPPTHRYEISPELHQEVVRQPQDLLFIGYWERARQPEFEWSTLVCQPLCQRELDVQAVVEEARQGCGRSRASKRGGWRPRGGTCGRRRCCWRSLCSSILESQWNTWPAAALGSSLEQQQPRSYWC